MATDNSQTKHFAQHYKQLELHDRADWELARANYRRLVHLWHPDRFAQRPRERAHAQQQFINLTKSYNVLRNFYRKNKRLPFETAQSAANRETNASMNDSFDETSFNNTPPPRVDAGMLARDPADRERKLSSNTLKKAGWLLGGGTIVFGTIMLFLVLDRKANQATALQGREVVKEAPQSDFLPSAAEIRRSQTRGAFVKPTK